MSVNRDNVTKTFKEIGDTTLLWDDSLPISLEEYEKLLAEDDADNLLELLELEDEQALKRIQLEDLMRMSFDNALQIINKLSLAKRIDVLADLDARRLYLYNQAARYGVGNPKDPNYLTTRDWKAMMGKIKHLEILQAWLYGVM
jgi:hypothetical protein